MVFTDVTEQKGEWVLAPHPPCWWERVRCQEPHNVLNDNEYGTRKTKEKRQGQIDTSKLKSVEKKSYVDGLTGKTRERYLEKLNLIDGVDPHEIDHRNWKYDLSLYPAITYPDLVFYLSNTPSPYMLEDFKAYESLEALNQFLSGWVKEIRVMEIGDNQVVSARVSVMLLSSSN